MLEALLAHELAHVRRRDYLVNLLQGAVETLLFYHPGRVVAVAARAHRAASRSPTTSTPQRHRDPQPLALALQALDSLPGRTAYAAALPSRTATPTIAGAHGGQLMPRIKVLLAQPPGPD
jgi:hypothetical protein